MKILFLCPSLEYGKDGVGDYTRHLVRSLEALGIMTACVALHDRHLDHQMSQYDQISSTPGTQSAILRLSSMRSWQERMKGLQSIIDDFEPDWVSLQYVPYGFHQKGIPLRLPHLLSNLRGNFRWHIMFHELWVGDGDSPLRTNFYYGLIQQWIASRLCRDLRALCHTSNFYYRDLLQSIGCTSSVLPLFSNIEITQPFPDHRKRLLAEAGITATPGGDDSAWVFILFGTLYPDWKPAVVMERLEKARCLAGKTHCLVVAAGNLGAAGSTIFSEMLSLQTKTLRVLRTGFLPEEQISSLLQSADFGIATSPLLYLGKSGSTAAMMEHGLPVIVSRLERIEKSSVSIPPGIIPLDKTFEKAMITTHRVAPLSGLGKTVHNFGRDLDIHDNDTDHRS